MIKAYSTGPDGIPEQKIGDDVNPWTDPGPKDKERDCCFSVNQLYHAVEICREVLGSLDLHPQ